MKPSGPGLLFAGRFLITVLISLLVMSLLRFSISSWFSFGKLYFYKNLSISSKLSILFAYSCWQLEKAMAPHSSTLAWKIPWTEEPGRLQSMGSLRVRPDWATSLSHFTFMHWRRKWHPTPVFLPGESQGQGSLVAAVYGVAQSRTWLQRLSSSSSIVFPWSIT